MNRRAFTLIELLVVIAIIAILAAILFPVFAQAKESAKKAADVSNQKQVTLGVIQYQADYDDLYPLAWGQGGGIWPWNYSMYYPADYPSGAGSDSSYAIRIQASPMAWLNSTQPYIKSIGVAETPGAPMLSGGNVSNAAVGKQKGKTGLTYNGLLMGYNQSGVAQPADLILVWTGRGKANIDGGILTSPALQCPQANAPCIYVPSVSGCSASTNGQQSAMFGPAATMWVYAKGINTAFCDGHVKFRRVGAQTAATEAQAQAGNGPDTDYNTDPFTSYGPSGIPYSYWWDGCHAWLFRPDYTR